MGLRITDRHHVALYDSTAGQAFGPMFGDTLEAEGFLNWVRLQEAAGARFDWNGRPVRFIANVRRYSAPELEHVHRLWLELPHGERERLAIEA